MFTLLVIVFPCLALRHHTLVTTGIVGTAMSVVLYYTVFWSVIADELRNHVQQSDTVPARWFVFQRFVWSLGLRDHYLGIYVLLALIGLAMIAWRQHNAYMHVLARVFGAMLLTSGVLGLLQVVILFNPTRYIIFSHVAIVIFSAFSLTFLSRYRGSWLPTRLLVCATLTWSLRLWALAFALHANRAWQS